MVKQIGCHCYGDVTARVMLIESMCKLEEENFVCVCVYTYVLLQSFFLLLVVMPWLIFTSVFFHYLFYVPSARTLNSQGSLPGKSSQTFILEESEFSVDLPFFIG